MINDLGDDGGSQWQTMVGNNVGDHVGDDVGDRDDGSNNASNNAGSNAGKGDGRDAGGEGGGLLAATAAAAAATAAAAVTAVAAAYCRGCLLFIVNIFVCGIFMMCGGIQRGHTSPHTLVTLEVCRHTFGWGRLLSSKIVVVCKYQRLSSKKVWQPKLVVFYQSFEDKK